MTRRRTWIALEWATVVLIAAAVAGRVDREHSSTSRSIDWQEFAGKSRRAQAFYMGLVRAKVDARAGLVAGTVGVGALAIRRRRGRRGRMGRGRAALLAANLALGWRLLQRVLEYREGTKHLDSLIRSGQLLSDLCSELGWTPPNLVVGAWVWIAYAGHWRDRPAPPDGPERTGRFIGWAWLGLMVCSWVTHGVA